MKQTHKWEMMSVLRLRCPHCRKYYEEYCPSYVITGTKKRCLLCGEVFVFGYQKRTRFDGRKGIFKTKTVTNFIDTCRRCRRKLKDNDKDIKNGQCGKCMGNIVELK